MTRAQALVCLIAFLSYTIRTAITCFALDQLIKFLGEGKLGLYYAGAAVITMGAVAALSHSAKRVSPIGRFLLLHGLILAIAVACLMAPSDVWEARLLFLTMMGFGLLIYFSNWSVAGVFIDAFQAVRLFPVVGFACQAGVFSGSLLAMASYYGLSRNAYFATWIAVEVAVLALGVVLLRHVRRAQGTATVASPVMRQEPTSLLQLLRQCRLVPRLMAWVFVWGVVCSSTLSLAGATFGRTGLNLTALYGGLALVGAVLSSVFSVFVFPRVVRVIRLAMMLLVSSVALAVVLGPYVVFDTFGLALAAFVATELMDSSFVVLSVSTQFSIYPVGQRDRLRLLSEVFSQSAGTLLVGLLFALPTYAVTYVVLALLGVLVVLGVVVKQGFAAEILAFLGSSDREAKSNAIALLDFPERNDAYLKVLAILRGRHDPASQVQVLNTLANLQSVRPAPEVLRLTQAAASPPALKTAALRYFGSGVFRQLDPFLQYQVLATLRAACRYESSDIVRSMAVRVLVENGPLDMTVGFLVTALQDSDDRVVANAIEGLRHVDYPGVTELLRPFLHHSSARIRANAAIAVWKYADSREGAQRAIDALLHATRGNEMASGVYAVGEVRDDRRLSELLALVDRPEDELRRGVPVALLKLGNADYLQRVVDLILGDDDKQAVNTCYLTLRLDPTLLNEGVMAAISQRGETLRARAHGRYERCGAACGKQLELLGITASIPAALPERRATMRLSSFY